MLFSEIYGNYYNAIASILDEALEHPAAPARIREIVDEKAFAESILTIPEELAQGGRWPLLDEEGYSLLSKETYMPLTTLQKRWLKTLLFDPRIRLFAPEETGPEDFVKNIRRRLENQWDISGNKDSAAIPDLNS